MKMRNNLGRVSLIAATIALGACDLDLENPNSPTEEAVLSDINGAIALGVGMQGQFAQSIEDFIVPPALVTDEWGTRSRALLSYIALFTGQNFDNTYDIINAPYASAYLVAKSANTLMSAVPNLELGAGLTGGLNATAKLFKAMALGMAAQQFEVLPADAAVAGGLPIPRADVIDTVLALLESAKADIANVSDADLAIVRSRVLSPGTNLRATIDAMIARYALLAGEYQRAINAATLVSPTVLSTITFPTPTINPVQNLAFGLQYVGGTTNFVAAAEAGDRRPNYWLVTTTAPIGGNPGDSLSYTLRKYTTPNDAFPLYLPDEMKLIRAEAEARLGNLQAARDLINQVRTQTTSPVDEPVAGLPALTVAELPDLNAILRQVAYERRYELYMQGLRWDDVRRLPGQTAPVVQFLPIPARECAANQLAKDLPQCQ